MENKLIYGIQQIGVGVDNADEAFEWYASRLGAGVPVFEDNNVATHMAPYMGGEPHKKRAILAFNMQGGCGYEIWQYLDRKPTKPEKQVQIGDLGINSAFIKTKDIEATYKRLQELDVTILTEIRTEPDSKKSFHAKDPYDNLLRIKEYDNWYADKGHDIGGAYGCSIGVSNIENSLKLYSEILEYDEVIYDETGVFEDLKGLPNGNGKFRRILLAHKSDRPGGFSKLYGTSQIELIQPLDYEPVRIFENRYWGDIGYIHLCFDIRNMKALTEECAEKGFPFKVLSEESFDMGDANGHWGYIEDCDGTLVEFVETHKVELVKAIGLKIDLKNRNPKKPLPNWMIKAMSFKRLKKQDEY